MAVSLSDGADPPRASTWVGRLIPGRRLGEAGVEATGPDEVRAGSLGDGLEVTRDERLRRLQAVTGADLSLLELDDLLVELLERTRDLLEADTATIMLLDSTGQELVATAASGLEEEVRQGVRVPVGAGFTGRVAALAEPVILDHVDHTNVVSQVLVDKRLASVIGVPMLAGARVIGVLYVGALASRRFTDGDVELLRLVADRASLATQARLSQLGRAATLALQRSLLPARPPTVTGLEVAARYVPGAEVGVGGDWYDLFPLPSGHVGVAIGDVAGSGLRAAVVMGRIRSALRAYALETNDPADVLSRLDRKIQLFEPDAMATAVYAVIDPARTTVTISVAGHLPPVLVPDGQPARLVDAPADLPLGAYPSAPRRTRQLPLPAGTSLFLYTDGLIERRGRPIAGEIDRLLAALGPGNPEELCRRATAVFLHDQPATDDVAIVAVRRTGCDGQPGAADPGSAPR
jgi:serine phosphatase RsbU (regulator of sigma subunit)